MMASQCIQFQSLSLIQRKKHISAWIACGLIISITTKIFQMNDSTCGVLFFWCTIWSKIIDNLRQEYKLHLMLLKFLLHICQHPCYVSVVRSGMVHACMLNSIQSVSHSVTTVKWVRGKGIIFFSKYSMHKLMDMYRRTMHKRKRNQRCKYFTDR